MRDLWLDVSFANNAVAGEAKLTPKNTPKINKFLKYFLILRSLFLTEFYAKCAGIACYRKIQWIKIEYIQQPLIYPSILVNN